MLQDRLILSHLKRTHISTSYLSEAVTYEEISPTLFKINDATRIEFHPIIEDVWEFSLLTSEGSKSLGRIYRVSNSEFVARSSTAPNIEKTGNTLISSALDLCVYLGEI